ncbi:MAG: DUF2911 domain-containing protein [Cyclobacteriaceae bacterium]
MISKKILLTICIILPVTSLTAQDVGAATLVSQKRTTTANIGNADITITYHSPSVQGRKIFGGQVPYDFEIDGKEYPWRAGSNQRTTIEFSHDVVIEGQPLAAGNYGFVVLVSEKEWTMIFSTGKSWGSFNYDPKNDALRVTVNTEVIPHQEWLSYNFANPKSQEVDVELRWEKTMASFTVKTDALANTILTVQEKEEKTAGDYQDLAEAIVKKDPSKIADALEWIDKSIELKPSFYNKMVKVKLLLLNEDKKGAEALKKQALDSAAGFNYYYYGLQPLLLDGDKKESLKILNQRVKEKPEEWQTYLALGEYYQKIGDQEKATENFKKSYEYSSDNWKNYARYLYLQNKLMVEQID